MAGRTALSVVVGLALLASVPVGAAAANPSGDGRTADLEPRRGWLFSCTPAKQRPRGAKLPWMTKRKWFPEKKPVVDGGVRWPKARFSLAPRASGRSFTLDGNGLPVNETTGDFPVSPEDDAAPYVDLGRAVAERGISGVLPRPRIRDRGRCVDLEQPIGIALNGVPMLPPTGRSGLDLVARDVVDSCGGVIDEGGGYAYRAVPSCLLGDGGVAPSLIGYARDGHPVTGPGAGRRRLDECHGRVGPIQIDGDLIRTYHYEANGRFPYLLGCFRGRPRDWRIDPAGAGSTSVRVAPRLFPSFDRAVTDYVTECDSAAVQLSAELAPGSTISVEGGRATGGSIEETVPLQAGQAFRFSIRELGGRRTYHVRCLPPAFPRWTFERSDEPANDFYTVEPNLSLSSPPTTRYVIMFDDRGVPIWWFEDDQVPVDSKILGAGTIAWATGAKYEIRRLDGTVVRTVAFVGGPTDLHDLQEVGNGNMLVLCYCQRDHVDTSAYGGTTDSSVLDSVIQEIDPGGDVVWEWNSKDHIDLAETGRWWPSLIAIGAPYDMTHINAVEVDGGSLLISMRHTDSIYKIDRATGGVVWKLGGTSRPESLTVEDDPYGDYPLGGQHDPRMQPDGTVTIYDNATGLTSGTFHPPRAVRYAIDESADTASLVESLSDPAIPSSRCCGSARRSANGSWLIDWTHHSNVTEYDRAGTPVFRLGFGDRFTYRAFPVPNGRLSRDDLRAGMDAMFPRP